MAEKDIVDKLVDVLTDPVMGYGIDPKDIDQNKVAEAKSDIIVATINDAIRRGRIRK